MIVYQDILGKLKEKGFTSYRIRKERILPESTLTKLRTGQLISLETLDVICGLCQAQPGELLIWTEDPRE